MSLSNESETAFLNLLFANADWANIGDEAGLQNSSTAGNFYVSLHTADPGDTNDQTTSETSYTNYQRVAVERSASGWTVADDEASNAAAVSFAACGATGATITHFGIGTASSGAGHMVATGALTASLAVSSGITPSFAIGALTVTAS